MPVCKPGSPEQPTESSTLEQGVSGDHSLCPVPRTTLLTSAFAEMTHSHPCSRYSCRKFPNFIQQIPHCPPVEDLALVLQWNLPPCSQSLWSWACVTLRSSSGHPGRIPAELLLFSFPLAAGERQARELRFPFGISMPF